jgi:hypothetical protein
MEVEMSVVAEVRGVAKKKTGETPKRYGTLIRVSDAFADALRDVTGFEKTTVAEFCDTLLLPVVRKRYRDAVIKKARGLEGGGT